jgi:ubiquinone/menaquinone biosynthesis C-methylase UbiE
MYQYPTDEATTDAIEVRLDPHKRLREVAMILAMMGFRWDAAMDFGCGTGRNLSLFHRARSGGQATSLLAVDADAKRLARAKEATRHLRHQSFSIEYVAGGAEDMERITAKGSLDLILCCQVLTHMSTAAAASAIRSFGRLLKPQGALIVCVPFHNLGFSGDYFHVIDLAGTRPNAKVSRRKVGKREFDLLTASHALNRLPVRAFRIDANLRLSSDIVLPHCTSAPRFFLQFDAFEPAACLVYSIHKYYLGKAVIGDLILKLIRS